jgi:hypothetical protein
MIEVTERIDLDKLNLLNNLTIGHYISISDKKKYNINEVQKHFDKIKSYLSNHIKSQGKMIKLYKHSERSSNGRLYGVDSIQSLDGNIRGFLFGESTTDIDMVNSAPTILEWICKTRDIRCPALTEYVNNRDVIINQLKTVGVDDPKLFIIKMLFSEKKKRIKYDYKNILHDLNIQFETIRRDLQKEPDYVEILTQAMEFNPVNTQGSFLNRVICIYENQILKAMSTYIHSNNIEIASYMYDGLLVYGNFYNDPNIITELEITVENKFPTLNMKLKMKPHSNVIKAEDLQQMNLVEKTGISYQEMKQQFELDHCKIIMKGVYITEYKGRPLIMTKKNLTDCYEHLVYIDHKGKTQSFIKQWVKDPNIRSYIDIDTFPPPLVCPPEIYNLWIPFAMESVTEWKPKKIDIFLNHIKILCNHETETFDYCIKWLAQMIQYPAEKSTLLLFQGEEGCGKGRFFQIIENMIGSNKYLEVTNPEVHIWGNFNPLMASAYFVHLSELSKKQTLDSENKIKGLITDNALQINCKGKDPISTKNYSRFAAATNDSENMSTHAKDRRKFLISASNELVGEKNKPYFDRLTKKIENVNYIKSFYEYLKNVQGVENFTKIAIPMTKYQKVLCELSITPIESFIKDKISRCQGGLQLSISSRDLFDEFQEYLHISNTKYDVNLIKFGVRLTNLKLPGIETTPSSHGNIKKFDIPALQKHFGLGCIIE